MLVAGYDVSAIFSYQSKRTCIYIYPPPTKREVIGDKAMSNTQSGSCM